MHLMSRFHLQSDYPIQLPGQPVNAIEVANSPAKLKDCRFESAVLEGPTAVQYCELVTFERRSILTKNR